MVEKKKINQEKILILTYNKAVEVDINKKLKEMKIDGIGQTFHGLNALLKEKYHQNEQRSPEVFIRDDVKGMIG